jgi:hypothetical protein
MNVQFHFDGDEAVATIGTNAVQARRLEYGFVGYDSLGRYFNQGPLEHWRPRADELERWVETDGPLLVLRGVL